MENNCTPGPQRDLVKEKLNECIERLKNPDDSLTWSHIKSDYAQYGISKRKVFEHMRGIHRNSKRGRQFALPARVEKSIVDSIVICEQMGFSKTKRDVEKELIIPLASGQEKYPFKKSTKGEYLGPSGIWWDGFLQRQSNRLQLKTASPLNRVRAAAANPRAFESVYDTLRGRMEVPENIIMIDETAIPTKTGWEKHVLGERNRRPAHIPAGTVDERHMTLVAACSANGCMLPPAYICAGKHIMEVSAHIVNNAVHPVACSRAKLPIPQLAWVCCPLFDSQELERRQTDTGKPIYSV